MHIIDVGNQYAFNGSVAYYKNKLVIVYRINFSDLQIGIIEDNKLVNSWFLEGSHDYIDPRVLNYKDSLFLSVSNQSKWMRDQMEMIELDDDLAIKHKTPMKGFSYREKNWIPFIYDDDIYYVYQPSPHIIIKADFATGDTEKIYETNWNHPQCSSIWGNEWRGSSQAILIENVYLSTIHTECHYVFFYTFSSSPPFEVRKISPIPIFPGANKHPYYWVHYVNGLAIKDKIMLSGGLGLTSDGKATLSGGIGDVRISIKEYDINEVLSSLVDVNKI